MNIEISLPGLERNPTPWIVGDSPGWESEIENVVVSFSGGRTSALMAKLMRNSKYWSRKKMIYVFSNTGREHEATLEFVRDCDREFDLNVIWIEPDVNPERGRGTRYRIVSFETADRTGKPYEQVIKKYGLTNRNMPHCTREMKTRAIEACAKDFFKRERFTTAMGMRIDEPSRIKPNGLRVYPMFGWAITGPDVRAFWNLQPFDLKLKDYEGNCDLCWKKSIRKKLTLIRENPSIADWWIEMERKYSNADVHERDSGPAHFHQDNVSTLDLVEMAKRPFVPASDPFWMKDSNPKMDAETSCLCERGED